MKFTKEQKEIIRAIASEEVWDISSFASRFQLKKTIRYDRKVVKEAFDRDPRVGVRYCPRILNPTPANLVSEEEFVKKCMEGQNLEEEYIRLEPMLEQTQAARKESVRDQVFSYDFYSGVEIINSFDRLVDFLTIWQYLRDQALVLEVSQPLCAETAALFFQREDEKTELTPEGDKVAGVLRFSDLGYLQDGEYRLSRKWMAICDSFLGRRLYPAPGLKWFINNRFRTREEVDQARTLTAAWVGILVAILIALLPYVIPCLPAHAGGEELQISQSEWKKRATLPICGKSENRTFTLLNYIE